MIDASLRYSFPIVIAEALGCGDLKNTMADEEEVAVLLLFFVISVDKKKS